MRCEPESVFSSWPSLNHCIEGVGLPSALQLNVKGSFFGTTISMGCSMIRGFCAAEKRTNKCISLSANPKPLWFISFDLEPFGSLVVNLVLLFGNLSNKLPKG
uniref:Uncharacterized protein n=1 Tax=Glossina pallidipes TaxID=7398 RepID=A0A1A9ZJ92_GLOPL